MVDTLDELRTQNNAANSERRAQSSDLAGLDVIELTATEFQLLSTLARKPGRGFTRAQLLDAIHGLEVDAFERAIDTHIKNIRRKIERRDTSPSTRASTPTASG
jgi:DNA-binding response OmpR family regulator